MMFKMGRSVMIPLVLLTGSLVGCGADAQLGGRWDATLSWQPSEDDKQSDGYESYPGDLEIHQFMDSIEGTGTVIGAGGPECLLDFAIKGKIANEENIPVELTVTEKSCSNAIIDETTVINLSLIDNGEVLYGHTWYDYLVGNETMTGRLYFSASIKPY